MGGFTGAARLRSLVGLRSFGASDSLSEYCSSAATSPLEADTRRSWLSVWPSSSNKMMSVSTNVFVLLTGVPSVDGTRGLLDIFAPETAGDRGRLGGTTASGVREALMRRGECFFLIPLGDMTFDFFAIFSLFFIFETTGANWVGGMSSKMLGSRGRLVRMTAPSSVTLTIL
ncbi:other haspin protein kinase [Moniliophthora roreri]|nr:other haspin protein kinase [Moniliophthora roreri]